MNLKESKSHEVASSSSSDDETDASFEEEANDKKGGKGDKRSYNTTLFNYDNLLDSSTFTSVPIGKAPHFNGMDHSKWSYSMRMHLISLSLSIWNIVHVEVDFPDKDEEPDFEQLQQIHHNAKACSVLLSSLAKDEFCRVNSLENAKDIWDSLPRAHECTKREESQEATH
jgi:hypothetical protein